MQQAVARFVRAAVLFAMSWLAVPVLQAADRFPISFKPFEVRSSIDGREIIVPISGTATAADLGTALDVQADITANLADLAAKIGGIIQARAYRDDDCNEKLNVRTVNLRAQPPVAILSIAAHYEKWACVLFGKTRLFEQDGEIRVAVTPEVAGDAVAMRLNVVGIDADGALGILLRSEAFARWVTAQVQGSFPNTLTIGRVRDALPAALKDVPATLSDLVITDAGNGTPAIRGTLRLQITGDQIASMLRDLQKPQQEPSHP